MKKDILTLARFNAVLLEHDINFTVFDMRNQVDYSAILSLLSDESMTVRLLDIIGEQPAGTIAVQHIINYIMTVGGELAAYDAEIARRRKHAVELEVYRENTPEELAEKLEEFKNVYQGNTYFDMYISLTREGLRPEDMTISEALLASEYITCQNTIKALMELLGFITGRESFVESIRHLVKFANFSAFALDIYEEVDQMYKEQEKKKE